MLSILDPVFYEMNVRSQRGVLAKLTQQTLCEGFKQIAVLLEVLHRLINWVYVLIDTAQVIGASVLTMGLVAMWRRRRVTRVAS